MEKISVIAPMYNEQELVSHYCNAVVSVFEHVQKKYELELILVDDGSTDTTLSQMQKAQSLYPTQISILSLSRNFGLEGAILAGLKHATGKAIVVMDADLQDPPNIILEMIAKWENGADIVVGSRIARPNDTVFKKISAKIFYYLLNHHSGKIKLEREAANFRLLSRRALEIYLNLPETNASFRILVPYLGLNTAVVEYQRDKRFSGKTKYHLGAMIRYALDSITGISIEPLRKLPYLAILPLLCAIVSGIAIFTMGHEWAPFMFVITVISVLFFALFIAIALIGEYLGQIHIESKGRPIFIVNDFTPAIKETIDHD